MQTSSPSSATGAADGGRRVLAEVALAVVVAGALVTLLDLPDHALLIVGLAMAAGAAAVIVGAMRAGLKRAGLGWPNRVTLMRALVGAVLVGHLFVPDHRAEAALLATIAVVSDAVDGWLARRLDAASAFGARFDMETDAALVLVLSALLFVQGVAGPWVLAIGLARYAFIAALALMPWLDRPLPPSERRRAAAAFTMVALVLALMPALPPLLGFLLSAAATLATLVSFAIDVAWLVRRRGAT